MSGADLRGEMSRPGQISRRGCFFVLLALVLTAATLICAALFVLHRIFPAPPAVWSKDGEQFTQLRSLQGTWQDSVGGKMVFTDASFAPDGILNGKVTFVNVPQVFSWAVGPPPPSYGHGTWKIGTNLGEMMGLQNQPGAGIISIQFGTGTLGNYPLVGLEVEGPASAPSFLCEYPDHTNACTFRKIS
ncbi:MAG: hypothetical protein M3Z75_18705 [Actinomycetota bacterium]|nr:hypothetical protein [Actinomycetota bacterium]